MATIQLTKKEIQKVINSYKKFEITNTNQHAVAMFKFTGCTITIFKSGKVVFQGMNAEKSAIKWGYKTQLVEHKNFESYIGSDEVGTGDFFGPIVVVGTCVNKNNSIHLKNLGVKDSKKLSDKKIIEIVEKIKNLIPWEYSIINNIDYNKAINKMNMNVIKAYLHNEVFNKLSKKCKFEAIIIDEFASKKNYYDYLKNANNVVRDIIFEQKAEKKYIGIAAASMIARYIFLNEIEELSKIVGFKIKLGAGTEVDKQINLLNYDKLVKVGKLNFKNYKKTKE